MTTADLAMLLIGVLLGYGLAEARRWVLGHVDRRRAGTPDPGRPSGVVPIPVDGEGWVTEADRMVRQRQRREGRPRLSASGDEGKRRALEP